jgi:hypothetical protein
MDLFNDNDMYDDTHNGAPLFAEEAEFTNSVLEHLKPLDNEEQGTIPSKVIAENKVKEWVAEHYPHINWDKDGDKIMRGIEWRKDRGKESMRKNLRAAFDQNLDKELIRTKAGVDSLDEELWSEVWEEGSIDLVDQIVDGAYAGNEKEGALASALMVLYPTKEFEEANPDIPPIPENVKEETKEALSKFFAAIHESYAEAYLDELKGEPELEAAE